MCRTSTTQPAASTAVKPRAFRGLLCICIPAAEDQETRTLESKPVEVTAKDANAKRHSVNPEDVLTVKSHTVETARDSDEATARPKVGDRVLVDGRMGSIVEDDHSRVPFQVRFNDGTERWFFEKDVQRQTIPHDDPLATAL